MKLTKLLATGMVLLATSAAMALDIKPYSAVDLANAEKADKPVALHFHADWCPTCRAQSTVLDGLKAEPGLELTVLVVNYDTERALKRRFNVRAQSTLVVLHGPTERSRLVGDTTAAGIRTALKSAL